MCIYVYVYTYVYVYIYIYIYRGAGTGSPAPCPASRPRVSREVAPTGKQVLRRIRKGERPCGLKSWPDEDYMFLV